MLHMQRTNKTWKLSYFVTWQEWLDSWCRCRAFSNLQVYPLYIPFTTEKFTASFNAVKKKAWDVNNFMLTSDNWTNPYFFSHFQIYIC